jgi:hypothetical protein
VSNCSPILEARWPGSLHDFKLSRRRQDALFSRHDEQSNAPERRSRANLWWKINRRRPVIGEGFLQMLTRDEARLQVFLELRRVYGLRSSPEEIVILDEHTIERPRGWMFFYTTRGWRDGDFRYVVGGIAPYIVNRFEGSLRLTGTAVPVEHYIKEYEAELAKAKAADSGSI